MVATVAVGGCTPTPRAPSYVLNGGVYDEATGNALPGAAVVHVISRAETGSLTDGSFNLTYQSPANDPVVVKVSAPGFVTRYMRVFEKPPERGTFSANLRPVGSLTQISLPSGSDAAVHIPIQRGDSTLDLAIPASGLVHPDGSPASGNANVSLTYWNPNEKTDTIPGLLYAEARDEYTAAIPLKTYGMADIEITQGDDVLQVASDRTLTLKVTQPASFQAYLASNPNIQPQLYSLDRASGLWHLEATQTDGSGLLAYDPNAGVFTAQLKHLSDWNLDDLDPTLGGCVTGQILDQCGNPAPAGVQLRMFMMAWEELHEFDSVTLADGTFCRETGTRLPGFGTNESHIYVSGTNPNNSDMCPNWSPPFPKNCLQCSTSMVSGGCCRYEMDYQVPFGAPIVYMGGHGQNGSGTCGYVPWQNKTYDPFEASGWVSVTSGECHGQCNTPTSINVTPCHFCSGSTTPQTSCTVNQLPVTVGTASCNNIGTVTVNVPGLTCPVLLPKGCPAWIPLGNTCTDNEKCCAQGTICNDHLCVPMQEPQ